MRNFCVFGKTTLYRKSFKMLFRKFLSPHWPTGNRWNRALFIRQQNFAWISSCRYGLDRAQNLPRPAPNNVPRVLQMSSKSVHLQRIAERVNTAKTRRKMNPILGWSLALSRIKSLSSFRNCHEIRAEWVSNGSNRYRVFRAGSWAWWRQGDRQPPVRWHRTRCRSRCGTTRHVRIRALPRIGPRQSPQSRSFRPSLHNDTEHTNEPVRLRGVLTRYEKYDTMGRISVE